MDRSLKVAQDDKYNGTDNSDDNIGRRNGKSLQDLKDITDSMCPVGDNDTSVVLVAAP